MFLSEEKFTMRGSIVNATNNQEHLLSDALLLVNSSKWATEGFIPAKLLTDVTKRKVPGGQGNHTSELVRTEA